MASGLRRRLEGAGRIQRLKLIVPFTFKRLEGGLEGGLQGGLQGGFKGASRGLQGA